MFGNSIKNLFYSFQGIRKQFAPLFFCTYLLMLICSRFQKKKFFLINNLKWELFKPFNLLGILNFHSCGKINWAHKQTRRGNLKESFPPIHLFPSFLFSFFDLFLISSIFHRGCNHINWSTHIAFQRISS